MGHASTRTGRAAHVLLLAALLLYVGGMAVEPVVHAAPAVAAAAAFTSETGADTGARGTAHQESGDEAPAGEHECGACKLTRVFTTTASPVAVSVGDNRPAANEQFAAAPVRGPPALSTSQPRAPPHA